MGKIIIQDLRVNFRVGVPALERKNPQELFLTIKMKHDFSPAAKEDDLRLTINYDALSKRLLSFGKRRTWKLIETLAEDITEVIMKEFKPESVKVIIKKFVIPAAAYVAVSTERSNKKKD